MGNENRERKIHVAGIHGDELAIVAPLRAIHGEQGALYIYEAHPEAHIYRVAPVPLRRINVEYSDPEMLIAEGCELPQLPEEYGFVDPNRQFYLWHPSFSGKSLAALKTETAMNSDLVAKKIIKYIGYSPSQALLQTVQNLMDPGVKAFITWHMDPHAHAAYMYHVIDGNPNSTIEANHGAFATRLEAMGYPLLSGVDSMVDPTLGHIAIRGLIKQTIIDDEGFPNLDGSLEAIVKLMAEIGIFPHLKHVFCFEIPGMQSPAQQKELIDLHMGFVNSLP